MEIHCQISTMFGMFEKWIPKHTLSKVKTLQESNGHSADRQQPVKLSIITQFYPPDYAATGQFIQELATQLERQGMHIHIFTGQPGYAFQTSAAPPLEFYDKMLIRRTRTSRMWPKRIRGRALNGLMFCLRSGLHLLKACWRGDILLITTEPPYLPVLGLLANICFNVPYVCLIYDLYPDAAVELKVIHPKHFIVRFWDTLNRWIWKRSQAAIVLSSTMRDRVAAKCPEIKDKIAVIHSWADPDWIKPIAKKDNWFARQHNLADKFTVLYSGNMGRCHDIDTILAAAEELQNDPVQFVFIGAGAKRQFCIDRVRELGLFNCLFLPYQDKETLPYSLTAADLSLVSISPGLEGVIAPSKLYGILAAGRPVAAICEKHSYLRQLLSEGKCGAAFNNGDGKSLAEFIRFLAADPQLAAHMGKAGRRYLMSHFTPEIIAQQYALVLNPLRKSRSQNPADRIQQKNTFITPDS
jgi:glycosyltransferase involved in cell wall biosynthesis